MIMAIAKVEEKLVKLLHNSKLGSRSRLREPNKRAKKEGTSLLPLTDPTCRSLERRTLKINIVLLKIVVNT
jgi:predicted nuclease with RNAse H fold